MHHVVQNSYQGLMASGYFYSRRYQNHSRYLITIILGGMLIRHSRVPGMCLCPQCTICKICLCIVQPNFISEGIWHGVACAFGTKFLNLSNWKRERTSAFSLRQHLPFWDIYEVVSCCDESYLWLQLHHISRFWEAFDKDTHVVTVKNSLFSGPHTSPHNHCHYNSV